MKPGIYDLAFEKYLKEEALNKSSLTDFDKSAFYCQWKRHNPTEPSAAMNLGSNLHCAALEPTKHRMEYFEAPEGVTKRAKKKWAEMKSKNPGKIIVSKNEMDTVRGMLSSIGSSKYASALLTGGLAERSVFWEDEDFGYMCKCRPDYLNPIFKTIIDLKTTNSIEESALNKTVTNFRYHWQQVHYAAGVNAILPGEYDTFVFIFVETKPPYPLVIRTLNEMYPEIAEYEMLPLRERFAECLESGFWPGPPDDPTPLRPQGWYTNQYLRKKEGGE